jgi:branched-chain amino acid transport system substrate-binding protein
MRKKTRSWVILAVIMIALASSVAVYWMKRASVGEVVVGVLFPLTGDAASYGEKGREAIDLAVSNAGTSGHCGSHNARVSYEDSRADPTTGVAAFRKLITADGVPVVIGDIVSAVTLAVAPIAESNRVLLMSPTSSAPAITQAGQYVYRIWPSDLAEGRAIAQFALDHGYRRASILHMTNDYGVAISDVFKETFKAGGGRVVSIDGYQADNTDFRTPLTRIRAAKPDVLYIAGYFADTAVIVRQARELGVTIQVLGTTAIEDDQFLRLAGDAADGIIYPLATGFDVASSLPQVREFVESFRSRYKHDPGWVEAQSYDAFMLVCTAMSLVQGDVTGTALKEAIDNMPSYAGIAGDIRFDENGDVIKPVVFRTIRNGRFTPIAPAE